MRTFIYGIISLVALLMVALTLAAEAKPAFQPVQTITIAGERMEVGYVALPMLSASALQVRDRHGRLVLPIYRYTYRGKGDGLFPYLDGNFAMVSKDTLIAWSPNGRLNYPNRAHVDWFRWNAKDRRFQWVRQNWSDIYLPEWNEAKVVVYFTSRHETGFDRAIRTAQRALNLARAGDLQGLDQLHWRPAKYARKTRAYLAGHPPIEQKVDWRRAELGRTFDFYLDGSDAVIRVHPNGRQILNIGGKPM